MKNFFECKDEKITEKTFSQNLIISVVSILLCLVALCSVTYAWFTKETASGNNTLVSGSFDLESVSVVKIEDGAATVDEISVTRDESSGKWSCELVAGTYTVTLKAADNATVKGHCIVTVGGGDPMHTAAIIGEKTANVGSEKHTDPFTFTLSVDNGALVTFEARWGVVVEPDIEFVSASTPTTDDANSQLTEQE